MKKVIVVLVLVFIQSITHAQSPISKGAFTISGNIFFSSQSFSKNSESNTIFTFNPQFGYFLFDHFYTALSIVYSHYTTKYNWGEQYGFGPTIRYYIDGIAVKPFIGIGYRYNTEANDGNHDNITSNETMLSCGIDYFVNNNFAIETSINYSIINSDIVSDVCLDYSERSQLLQIGIGVNYFFY